MIKPEDLAASNTEHGHQTALMCWAASSGIAELRWLFAIPNGGFRDARTAGKLKAEGVKAGVLDIFLPVPAYTTHNGWTGHYHGLFVEMKHEKHKNEKNRGLTKEQQEFIAFVDKKGYAVAVCYSWVEARDVILRYLGKA